MCSDINRGSLARSMAGMNMSVAYVGWYEHLTQICWQHPKIQILMPLLQVGRVVGRLYLDIRFRSLLVLHNRVVCGSIERLLMISSWART